jgi:hypothetical protein
MTQPATPAPGYRSLGYWSPIRLIAVAATIATLLAGFMIVFANLTGNSFKDWIATGIIAAGVALGCILIL